MYGLPQYGLLANKILQKHLYQYGFHPTKFTPGLWTHETKSIQFNLLVEDFGIQYHNKEDTEYLIKALPAHYKAVIEDWKCEIFNRVTLKWNYNKRTVDLSMTVYVEK